MKPAADDEPVVLYANSFKMMKGEASQWRFEELTNCDMRSPRRGPLKKLSRRVRVS